jgi:hypothetical protein
MRAGQGVKTDAVKLSGEHGTVIEPLDAVHDLPVRAAGIGLRHFQPFRPMVPAALFACRRRREAKWRRVKGLKGHGRWPAPKVLQADKKALELSSEKLKKT